MRIGILGTGDVGRELGNGFLAEGHEVRWGSRDAQGEKVLALVAQSHDRGSSGTFEAVADWCEVAVICVAYAHVESLLASIGPGPLAGKLVIDPTNPLDWQDGELFQITGGQDSAGENIQGWLPDSQVVKCFNIIGSPHMYKPDFPQAPTMWICGNDTGAKAQVSAILESFGWSDVIDAGDIRAARFLEPLCVLWVRYGMQSGGWDFAFSLTRKPG